MYSIYTSGMMSFHARICTQKPHGKACPTTAEYLQQMKNRCEIENFIELPGYILGDRMQYKVPGHQHTAVLRVNSTRVLPTASTYERVRTAAVGTASPTTYRYAVPGALVLVRELISCLLFFLTTWCFSRTGISYWYVLYIPLLVCISYLGISAAVF